MLRQVCTVRLIRWGWFCGRNTVTADILPEVEDHEDEAVDPLLGEAGLVLELPAVLGAVQGGELEAVVGQNTREGVQEGPFKQKKVKVYLNLKSYTEHEKETKQQSKLIFNIF